MLLGFTAFAIPGWLALNEWQKWRLADALEGEWELTEGYSKTVNGLLEGTADSGQRLTIRRTRGYELEFEKVSWLTMDTTTFDEDLRTSPDKVTIQTSEVITATVDSANTLLWWGGEWEVELKDGGQVLVVRHPLLKYANLYRRVR
jgi:hypothetical protein